MVLLPLEFTDCMQDSPYFRESLHTHETELETTSHVIKELAKDLKSLLSAAKVLSEAQRRLAKRMMNFEFQCIGDRQTDDEVKIGYSLKEFGRLINVIEDEKDRLLERSFEQFVEPLDKFRREQIGAVKERKKKFDKHTAKFLASQERYLALSAKKPESILQEADASLEMEKRAFQRAGLEYVCLIQEVQERKKFEFVEVLLTFLYGWLTFYHNGYEVAADYQPQMADLQSRLQKMRTNFNANRNDIHALMRKMIQVRHATFDLTSPADIRSGYLFMCPESRQISTASSTTSTSNGTVSAKKRVAAALTATSSTLVGSGDGWSKYYCQYSKSQRSMVMLPCSKSGRILGSTQSGAGALSSEAKLSFRIDRCWRLPAVCGDASIYNGDNSGQNGIERRFCFDIVRVDRPNTIYTFQAVSETDMVGWLKAMYAESSPPPPSPSLASDMDTSDCGRPRQSGSDEGGDATYLDDDGFNFVQNCITNIEKGGMDDQGLYRVEGVSSKVAALVGREYRFSSQRSSANSNGAIATAETKTLCSALKTYFRRLSPDPLLTYDLHDSLIQAAKLTSRDARCAQILSLIQTSLPATNRRMLQTLITHLGRVAAKSAVNLMPASNLAVCFGPTLLRPRIETVAAIMDVKFANIVVELLIDNWSKLAADESRVQPIHTSSNESPCGQSELPSLEKMAARGGHHRSQPPRLVTPIKPLSVKPSIKQADINRLRPFGIQPNNASHPASSIRTSRSSLALNAETKRLSSSSLHETGLSSKLSSVVDLTAPWFLPARPHVNSVHGPLVRPASVSRSLRPSQAPPPVPDCGKDHLTARALYACVANHPAELSFQPNEIITDVVQSVEPGWLEGCLHGRRGLVPENYVSIVIEGDTNNNASVSFGSRLSKL